MNEGSAPPIINWVLVSEESVSSAVQCSLASNKTRRTGKNCVIWCILTLFFLLNYLLSYHSQINNGPSCCWWLSIIIQYFVPGLAGVTTDHLPESEKWSRKYCCRRQIKSNNSHWNDPAVRLNSDDISRLNLSDVLQGECWVEIRTLLKLILISKSFQNCCWVSVCYVCMSDWCCMLSHWPDWQVIIKLIPNVQQCPAQTWL